MLRVFPLGGLGEIGMNCLALEQRGEVMLVDCGVTFDHRGLGVDVVHPDFSALESYQGRIAGVFLTHGHEDHIGALPYLLRKFDVPVWGTPYTLGLVRERANEHEILSHVRLVEVTPRMKYAVGSFTVEPIRVTHSIADATALAIETDAGTVVHTGDFKLDEDPPDGEHFDVARFEELGDEGVSLLLSDSTNIDAKGPTGGEAGVGEALEGIVRDAKGAVVVALFASNVHRLKMLGAIARKTGRRIVPLGRSVMMHSRVAHATRRRTGEGAGTPYLNWPPDLVHPADRIRELPKERVLAVATGTQAEANSALARIARGEHPSFEVGPGDTVVLSSRVIPGNEPEVFAVMGDLLRRGVVLKSWYSDRTVHVSGHAHRPEQQRMIEMVRPHAFVPVHGTLHHLLRHADLARELGVPHVTVLENGDVATVGADGVTRDGKVPTGRVHVFNGRAVPPEVLRERATLATEGIVFAVVPLNENGRVAGDIALTTRGVLDETEDARLLADARREARASVGDVASKDDAAVAEAVRLAIRRTLVRTLGWKPQVVVWVQRR